MLRAARPPSESSGGSFDELSSLPPSPEPPSSPGYRPGSSSLSASSSSPGTESRSASSEDAEPSWGSGPSPSPARAGLRRRRWPEASGSGSESGSDPEGPIRRAPFVPRKTLKDRQGGCGCWAEKRSRPG